MDDFHYQAIQALWRCRFLPGSYDKRFIKDMAQLGPYDMLSIRQEQNIERLAYHYRKQLARVGYHAPPELLEPYFERKRQQKTPDKIKNFWVSK